MQILKKYQLCESYDEVHAIPSSDFRFNFQIFFLKCSDVCHNTYTTMMKLDSFTLPKEDPQKHKSRDTSIEFC